jgi:ribosome-associated protein YbcJ (S4-like RNA binding protein)
MQYSVIFDESLLEKKIEEIKLNVLNINENELTTRFRNTYGKEIFEPLKGYLEESFLSGIVAKGKNFVDKFTKGAKEIATKVSSAIKEFSFKKIFATITKIMHKIKTSMLKQLMLLFEPLREVIIKNGFCTEDNKFATKDAFNKLIEIAKDSGKEVEADKVLNSDVVAAIAKSAKIEDVITEGLVTEDEAEEDRKGKAIFDENDVKFMDFFQKMMFKLGVKGTKLNGILSEISKKLVQGAAITGIISIIGALIPSAGIIAAIGGAVGAAIAAAPVLTMLIGAVLFGIGIFMFATWLLQPYPTIKNCRIFLSTIFSGSNPFDYSDATLGSIETVPMDKVKKTRPAFNIPLIVDLEEEGVEEEIPGSPEELTKEAKDIIGDYDNLDIDTIEDDEEIEKNKRIARIFVRNIFTTEGRDKIQDELSSLEEEEEDNEYSKLLEDFLVLIENIYNGDAISQEDEDGKKLYPYALSYKKVQDFLKDKNNSIADRMSKVIDVTDNFIDRIDKIKTKGKNEK